MWSFFLSCAYAVRHVNHARDACFSFIFLMRACVHAKMQCTQEMIDFPRPKNRTEVC